jgi:N-acetylmuramoyl-L-alanine amidase
MWLAEDLKVKLEKKGAIIYLSREDLQGISLTARPKTAAVIDADILLSLHHNALPDGVNPFKSRGTSTYYYHLQSRKLAYLIQEKLLKNLGLNDFGLFYDNLALCRPTQMPAVLVEAAFLMHPEEEALVISEKGRQKTVKAITEAIEEFIAHERKK